MNFKLLLLIFINLEIAYSQEINKFIEIESYVVRIYHNNIQVGTGFAYRQDSKEYIVTNYHVVEKHIENLLRNDTKSEIHFLPASVWKIFENGTTVSSSNDKNSSRFVKYKEKLHLPDKIKSRGRFQNFAKSVDLVVLNRKEKNSNTKAIKFFENSKMSYLGAEIYCASFPLSSYHMNLSKGISSRMILHPNTMDPQKTKQLQKQGYHFAPFLGYGDYVATSGSSGAPVFMIDSLTKRLILVGINRSTFNPHGKMLQKYSKKYQQKLDSIGSNFNNKNNTHQEIMEKYILFSNIGVNTIGVNQFTSASNLNGLILKLQGRY